MAKKEASPRSEARRPSSNKIKLHKYYKGMIALMKNPEQKRASKRMWVGLFKENQQLKIG